MTEFRQTRSNDLRLACAFALAVLAASVIAGWLLHSAALVEVLPNSVAMPFSVAACFALLALRHALPYHRVRLRTVARLLSITVLVTGLVGMAQLALDTDLGLELTWLHDWLDDGNPDPGRMPWLAALGLALAGFIGTFDRPRASAMRARVLLVATLLLLGVGVIAAVLHWLDLHLLYDWTPFASTGLPTAIALVLVASLNVSRRRGFESLRAVDSRDGERHILLVGAALVATAALVAGLAGIASQQHALGDTLAHGLQSSLTSRVALFKSTLDNASAQAGQLAKAPHTIALVGELVESDSVQPGATVSLPLQELLQRAVDSGHSSAVLSTPEGRVLAAAGKAVERPVVAAGLASEVPSQLLWQKGLYLRSVAAVKSRGEVLAVLQVERNLDAIGEEFFSVNGFGRTGEMALCTTDADGRNCFPGSSHERPYRPESETTASPRGAMFRALKGERGVAQLRDYRGHSVIAAYSSFGPELGAVLKQDTAEFYAPVRQALHLALPVLLVLVLLAVSALRWQLRPIVARLGQALRQSSEQQARITAVLMERKKAEETLFEKTELLEVTLRSIGDGVIRTDPDGRVRYMNRVAEEMTGWMIEDARGLSVEEVFQLTDAETQVPLRNPVMEVLATGQASALLDDSLLSSRDGEAWPVEESAQPIHDLTGALLGVVLVFHDVTRARRMASQMSYQAMHDPLTGLANRRGFEERLDALLRTAAGAASVGVMPVKNALMFLDLDKFKTVNDTCGHLAGDELLRRLTATLKDVLRSTDLLARLGGDEFAVLLECCSRKPAERVAESLREAVADFDFDWGEREFRVGVSIGLVMFDGAGLSRTELLRIADSACYLAKENGRNRVEICDAEGVLDSMHRQPEAELN